MSRASELAKHVNKIMKTEVLTLGNDPKFVVKNLPTGVVPIDYLLRGGLPRGRCVELYGSFSSLKTYIGLKAIAQTQRDGGVCALIDTEKVYDSQWAKRLGVNTNELLLNQPENGELAIDTAEVLVRGGLDLLVFDSVAATLPKAEQETKISDKHPQIARQAALMSLGLRKLTAANSTTAILWINQTRQNVGITFGNPETIPGGKALGYYASWRINIRKAGTITSQKMIFDGEKFRASKETEKIKISATVEKSKLDKPFNQIFFDYDLARATVDEVGFMVSLGLEQGIIEQKDAMWNLLGGPKIRGREKFLATVDVERLRATLDLPGSLPRPNRQDSGKRPVRSSSEASGHTHGPGQVESSGTVRPKKILRKSKPQKKALRWSDVL